jgi:hypothetical protein
MPSSSMACYLVEGAVARGTNLDQAIVGATHPVPRTSTNSVPSPVLPPKHTSRHRLLRASIGSGMCVLAKVLQFLNQ